MSYTLEISDDLKERLDDHLEEDETHEEFIEELVSIYETEGRSSRKDTRSEMGLEYPHFLINFKSTAATVGRDGLAFAETIDRVSADTGRRFVVSPHHSDIRLITDRTSLPVVAQSATPAATSETGAVTCEAVAAAGADGIFVNPPGESDAVYGRRTHRRAVFGVGTRVDRLRDRSPDGAGCTHTRAGLSAVRTAGRRRGGRRDDPKRARTDRRDRRPRLPRATRNRRVRRGGIRTAADVERAFDLGVDATGAASAALEADDREAWLRSIAAAIPQSRVSTSVNRYSNPPQ